MWSLTGLVGRAGLSTVMVIAATRSLGVEGYGVFVGVVAYVTLVAPLSAMGAGEVLIQRVAQRHDHFRAAWGAVLALLVTIGFGLYLLMVVAGLLILPSVDPALIAVFGAAEFVAAGLLANNIRAYAALDRYRSLAICNIGEGLARASAAVAFWMSGSDDLLTLGFLMLGTLSVVALASTVALGRHWGRPTRPTSPLTVEARAGAPFALTQTSDMIQTNIDKALLLSFGLDRDAGIYGAGYRLTSYAMMPVMAVLSASYPEFFRRGKVGLATAMAYSRSLRRPLIGLAVLAGAGAALLSPVAAWAFGDQFGGVVPVAVAMSAYPLVKALQALSGDVLTGVGDQPYRSRLQLFTALGNIGLNLVLIPRYGWEGALVATYVSEVALLGLLVLRVRALYRRRVEDRLAVEPVSPAGQAGPDRS
ncbi:MAG: oligosaccharide flippase family protein [Acidimicrobiia bacterium]|nr:oligosaccharide flippase family protein [Acidimicrobiia bacterium]